MTGRILVFLRRRAGMKPNYIIPIRSNKLLLLTRLSLPRHCEPSPLSSQHPLINIYAAEPGHTSVMTTAVIFRAELIATSAFLILLAAILTTADAGRRVNNNYGDEYSRNFARRKYIKELEDQAHDVAFNSSQRENTGIPKAFIIVPFTAVWIVMFLFLRLAVPSTVDYVTDTCLTFMGCKESESLDKQDDVSRRSKNSKSSKSTKQHRNSRRGLMSVTSGAHSYSPSLAEILDLGTVAETAADDHTNAEEHGDEESSYLSSIGSIFSASTRKTSTSSVAASSRKYKQASKFLRSRPSKTSIYSHDGDDESAYETKTIAKSIASGLTTFLDFIEEEDQSIHNDSNKDAATEQMRSLIDNQDSRSTRQNALSDEVSHAASYKSTSYYESLKFRSSQLNKPGSVVSANSHVQKIEGQRNILPLKNEDSHLPLFTSPPS